MQHQVNTKQQLFVGREGGLLLGRSMVLSESHISKNILDPRSRFLFIWSRIFLLSCLIGLFIDPMIFFWPIIEVDNDGSSCFNLDRRLIIAITCMRSLVDLLYALNIIIKFHTAYVSPSSRVFGKGELVMDRKLISRRYIKSGFFTDLAATLPLTQIVSWIVIPAIRSSINVMVTFIVLAQYIYRMYLTYLLSDRIIEATGIITKSAWGGAVYNLLLYVLGSHIVGSIWYLLTVGRQATCWIEQCQLEFIQNGTYCDFKFLDCESSTWLDRQIWVNNTQVFANCNSNNPNITFQYGIFALGLKYGAASANFLEKYFYSLWWGFQQMISNAQQLTVSMFIGETAFCSVIALVSLILFAQLISNMETYLQSLNGKVERWRLKQRDTEEWMRHLQLPDDIRECVRQFNQSKWLATRGADEEAILQGFPAELRRDIQHHLCLDLVRHVSFFSEMDDQLIYGICERLEPILSIEGSYVIREGDPVTEMLFIIRGNLESSTTNGGRAGFYNSIILRPGDFCGEELLTWALNPKSTIILPTSTRTVRALDEVEAFSLPAEDLKFVADQFRRLHSKKLQHTFRYYSHQWRTWAACLIQAAWHRFKLRKTGKDLSRWESFSSRTDVEGSSSSMKNLASTGPVSKSASTKFHRMKSMEMPKFLKPDEPDFSVNLYD